MQHKRSLQCVALHVSCHFFKKKFNMLDALPETPPKAFVSPESMMSSVVAPWFSC